MKSLLPKAIVICVCLAAATVELPYKSFREDFDGSSLEHFKYASTGTQAEFKRAFGVKSTTEPGTRVMTFKIDPAERAGAGRRPEIISNEFTHFGK